MATLPDFLYQPSIWVAAGAVLVALLWGLGDFLQFSPKRIWAISGVCFDESIRRRVLWITPLAILGVIIVSQLQKPIDEADAIRQTTKFCLFATGTLVTLTVIILACTNLPREIENRVIYTVVTKPTTRLEIVMGKVVGFGRVSAAILVIMGLFSWGYLSLRAWNLRKDISERLTAGAVDPVSRPSLEHYKEFGLLTAKRLEMPGGFQIYSRSPDPKDTVHWTYGGSDGDIVVPFEVSQADLTVPGEEAGGLAPNGVVIHARLRAVQDLTKLPKKAPAASQPFISPLLIQPDQADNSTPAPMVSFSILDQYQNLLIDPTKINNGKPLVVEPGQGEVHLYAYISPQQAAMLASKPKIYVSMTGSGAETQFGLDDAPFELLVPTRDPQKHAILPPVADSSNPGHPVAPQFRGRQGTYGQQLRGASAQAPFAVFPFRNALAKGDGEIVPMELRVGVERTGLESEESAATKLELRIVNHSSGQTSDPIIVRPENGRTSYFNVSAASVAGGNFDVLMRCLTNEQWIGLRSDSLAVVAGNEPFAWNLFKSLSVLWMMTLLVVIIAIFCSTFLSWPIALVLTVVILLGHWGVEQLGDATAPGVGNMVVNDMGFRDPAKAKVVSSSVEALSTMLRNVSAVLPDIGQYSATDEIERGMVIPAERLWDALKVTMLFGIPMLALGYIFLKNKEVAP